MGRIATYAEGLVQPAAAVVGVALSIDISLIDGETMGLALNDAALLREYLLAHHASGPIATLGVVDIRFTQKEFRRAMGSLPLWPRSDQPLDARGFFKQCGVSDLLSIDVSKYEGADVEFDLNNPDLPAELREKFGVVLNGGTLEHVFHVPNALTNISRMLRPGGLVVHILPMSNCVDHGFYQFSPTFMLDYYAASRFDLLNSASIHFDRSFEGPWQVKPALHGSYGEGLLGVMDSRIALHMFVARKRQDSLDSAIPIQSLYGRKFGAQGPATNSIEWFSPFQMQAGRRLASRSPVELTVASPSADGGRMWSVALPSSAPAGDSNLNPVASPLALFEDGKLLGPAHASHDAIRELGGGSYSHWGSALYFSSSDGSDPDRNGRQYTCKW
ncbi:MULTISPECIES: methyltransferase domain-containing protein [Bradyrhizobium]|uniref:methyltransferase domain-containing protein n=1 Tax=Bradyrhizobium brasilense TaxID=1419277 RepID=UPI0014577F1B|nr:methyltransferase domain-containing protein [Bradyrhizobium brasilense]NLS67572.1 methyltransferase domain-containing protein [Bradyrhizobium brasilense]